MALQNLTSNLSFYGAKPEVNFFPDDNSGAKGFTSNMFPVGSSAKPSQFIGISGNTFTYPTKIFNRFNALNIQDNSYNTSYIPQPYIVRGMQRKNKSNDKPQYWGYGSKSGFDDGLIRGGAVTVGDRIVADVERITKFMASPKGLGWVVKQVGLGLTNPKVESIGGPLTRMTRIHTGVTSLLSVAGSPLGLHFTTHGIPFVNEVASYENVQKAKKLLWNVPLTGNRLISLKQELGIGTTTSLIPGVGQILNFIQTVQKDLGFKGEIIESLSGLGGPNSLYGIGATTIRRYYNTEDGKLNFSPDNDPTAYDKYNPFNRKFNSYYKGRTGYNSSVDKTGQDDGFDRLGFSDIKSLGNKDISTPGSDKSADISTSTSRKIDYVTAPIGDINSYLTLSYGKIPKNKKSYNDFRDLISPTTKKETSIVGNNPLSDGDSSYYAQYNLEARYGLGELGKVGADRTNPYDFIVSGSQYSQNNGDRKILVNTTSFRGDKITALDIGSGLGLKNGKNGLDYKEIYPVGSNDFIKFVFSDGTYGDNVMVFRATIKGLTDSFTPGWDKLTIIGRPDGAYLYESYERSISFTFTVAALSRAEMIPMWRKLNYLASYTMPNLIDSKNTFGKASGPMMRITIGDLFNATPGFLESLSYTIPDDATWDIAEDTDNVDSKQLPMLVEAACTFKIISDYRPQLMGRAYSLSTGGNQLDAAPGQWLTDSRDNPSNKTK